MMCLDWVTIWLHFNILNPVNKSGLNKQDSPIPKKNLFHCPHLGMLRAICDLLHGMLVLYVLCSSLLRTAEYTVNDWCTVLPLLVHYVCFNAKTIKVPCE